MAALARFGLPAQDPAAPPPDPGPTVALPPLPEAPAAVPTPAPAASSPALRFEIPASPRLGDRPEPGPSLGSFLFGSLVVVALLTGTFLLLRRFARGSRFLAGGGAINVLARKPLGQKQEIFLVEVGPKVLVVGATRDRLATLGEFSGPDEVAALRAGLPGRDGGSARVSFRDSLREGLKEEEHPAPARVYDSIAEELARMRQTVQAWKA
jgi:flagellar biogenesis protein FliO